MVSVVEKVHCILYEVSNCFSVKLVGQNIIFKK